MEDLPLPPPLPYFFSAPLPQRLGDLVEGISLRYWYLQVHSPDEVESFVPIASGLLINVGTLSSEWVSGMKLAINKVWAAGYPTNFICVTSVPVWALTCPRTCAKANSLGMPWVLDPVGAGATPYRTKVKSALGLQLLVPSPPTLTSPSSVSWLNPRASGCLVQACLDLLAMGPTVVRGNASEIMALAGAAIVTRGVDSTMTSDSAVRAGQEIAKKFGCVVAVSGATDYVSCLEEDGVEGKELRGRACVLFGGHPLARPLISSCGFANGSSGDGWLSGCEGLQWGPYAVRHHSNGLLCHSPHRRVCGLVQRRSLAGYSGRARCLWVSPCQAGRGALFLPFPPSSPFVPSISSPYPSETPPAAPTCARAGLRPRRQLRNQLGQAACASNSWTPFTT